MGDPKRSLEIRMKYQRLKEEKEKRKRELIKNGRPERKQITSPGGIFANCKYCGTEIQLHKRTLVPVCKDPECQRRYAVYRVMLCRRRKREKESQAEN